MYVWARVRVCARCGCALGVFGARGVGACCIVFSAYAWTTPAPYFLMTTHRTRVTLSRSAHQNLQLKAGRCIVWGKEGRYVQSACVDMVFSAGADGADSADSDEGEVQDRGVL